MVGGGGGRGEVVVVGRAEIDTRAPFRSVKEAVVLFGERVLAGELSAGRQLSSVVSQNRSAATRPNHHAVSITAGAVTTSTPRSMPPPVTAELVVAKQELEKEREEKQKMAGCIQSLQEELSHAMSELKRLKAREEEEAGAGAATKVIDLEIDEGLSFTEAEKKPAPPRGSADGVAAAAGGELQKKRYVTFADPPTAAACRGPPLPDVVMELHRAPSQPQPQPQPHYYREPRFQRQMSAGNEAAKAMAAAEEGRKKKKKPLIPLVGALFIRRKKNSSSCHDDSF